MTTPTSTTKATTNTICITEGLDTEAVTGTLESASDSNAEEGMRGVGGNMSSVGTMIRIMIEDWGLGLALLGVGRCKVGIRWIVAVYRNSIPHVLH